ncbi:1288_t:CDS:2, partial [Acaulospora morrowiae]
MFSLDSAWWEKIKRGEESTKDRECDNTSRFELNQLTDDEAFTFNVEQKKRFKRLNSIEKKADELPDESKIRNPSPLKLILSDDGNAPTPKDSNDDDLELEESEDEDDEDSELEENDDLDDAIDEVEIRNKLLNILNWKPTSEFTQYIEQFTEDVCIQSEIPTIVRKSFVSGRFEPYYHEAHDIAQQILTHFTCNRTLSIKKKDDLTPVVSYGPMEHLQMDLVDFTAYKNDNDGFAWLLTI